ncbi:MAG: FAD-binding oxidoreductase [Candidatus Freyarchaeota archaeon]|nr:FAD-binding oxidoreductase [Candidatus Freyrarchaeum guaymaensis]
MVLLEESEVRRIHSELAEIVGSEYVSSRVEECFLYHMDFVTAEEPGRCDFVVMPRTAEEVRDIVLLANRRRLPVVPWVSGINIGGICNPLQGGIVVDLRRMNNVLEVNEDDMYAVVEGGITWGDLEGYLERHHPDLRAGITWSPPGTGVVPSYLCYGMLNLSMLGGTGSEFLNGVEVVLPTGRIIRTGTGMVSPYWYGRAPLPDITGLFVGWEGTTGIVTKASIKLWPNLPRRDFVIVADTVERGVNVFKALVRAGLGIVDMCCLNYTWAAAAQGYEEKDDMPFEPEKVGLPDFNGLVTLTAYTEKEMEAKVEALTEIAAKHGATAVPFEDAVTLFPENARGEFLTFQSPPIHFYCTWHFKRGGGGEWVGCYISSRHIAEYYKIAREVAKKYGKHASFYSRALFGGHHWVARVNIAFNKNDPEDVEKTRRCLMEIDEAVRRLESPVRYKAPPWAWERNLAKASKDSVEFIKELRRFLDPNGIMNPGHGP